ncbi:MAG: hypothetical protein B6D61_00320 [Bacteroidetes bacterium 4484_249]|nr:MAG: hypothetical protein B6D61_00320 [Bacteroidetes bacterium 4484_249]
MKTIEKELIRGLQHGPGSTKPKSKQNKDKNLSNRRKRIFWLCVLIILVSTVQTFSNGWTCWHQKSTKPWSINANLGITSYFGDLSIYDQNILKKISEESGSSFGIIVSKHFNKTLALSGQVLYGHIQAYRSKYNFTTQLLEYNLHARVDITNLFLGKRLHRVGIVGYAGIGHLIFRTVTNVEEGLQIKEVVHQARVPEFVYFFGGDVYYNISENVRITLDLALKQFQNDRLDNYVHRDNFDYYTNLSFGITYCINYYKKLPHRKRGFLTYSKKNRKHYRRG